MANNLLIDARKGMAEVRRLKAEGYSIKMLAVMIGEAWQKHDKGEYLTIPDRFLLGLRYSEFLSLTDNDEGYIMAATKRVEYLKVLGINQQDLNQLCLEICGLR